MSELETLAEQVIQTCRKLGADEVSVSVSRGSQSTLTRRGGQVEQATQATTRGLGISLLVDERFSSHSTSDLRPEALEHFLAQAVAATRFLEADPYRRQPDLALCGRGSTAAALDQLDPAWSARTAADRGEDAQTLEAALSSVHQEDVISSSVYVADGYSESIRLMSNGFEGRNEGAWFAAGGEMTLEEGNGKRPESAAYYGARYLSDLPAPGDIAAEIDRRTRERLGAQPIQSGSYTMVLQNRCVARVLGVLGGPLSGGSLHEKRSCLQDRLGTAIGSSLFTVIDDPTIPRGLGSRPWDGDALVARPRTIIEKGVLKSYNIGLYYGRKLETAPTSGSRSNWVIPPGTRSLAEITRALPRAILVTGFLGGNSNATTGDFSFGIRGQLLENGVPVQPLSEMNVTGNATSIFHQLVEVADDPWTWSSTRSPTLVFDDIQFSGN